MKGQCVFRCCYNGTTYRVLARPQELASSGIMYYTYVEQRRLEPHGWFHPEFAIDSVLKAALGCGIDIHWGSVL